MRWTHAGNRGVLLAGFWALVFAGGLHAQLAQAQGDSAELAESRARLASEGYVVPPETIASLVTAPRNRAVSLSQLSPDRRYFLREVSAGMPSVNSLGKAHYYFAGLQVDGAANRARSLTTRAAAGLELIEAITGKVRPIQVPEGATVSAAVWSPDGKQVAFIANFPDASRAYVADIETGVSRPATRTPLLATLDPALDWSADGSTLFAVLIPEPRAAAPIRPAIATGPRVRLWLGGQKSPQRNFASLFDEPFDQALFEYYGTGQLAAINLKTKAVRKLGAPAMINEVRPSPDGKYLRVTTMRRPFSYIVQYSNFGEIEEIWDSAGKVLAEVARRPLREAPDTSDDEVSRRDQDPKRLLNWMPAGEGLYFVESGQTRGQSDSTATPPAGGTGSGGQSNRPERLVRWNPPFGRNDTTVLYRADGPISQLVLSEDAQTAFIATTRAGQGEIYAVRLSEPTRRYTVVRQRGYSPIIMGQGNAFGGGGRRATGNDSAAFYNNPGALLTRQGRNGGSVAYTSSDGNVYLVGTQYYPNWLERAPRQFVDKVTLSSSAKNRVYEAPADLTETLTVPLDDDLTRAIVVRESQSQIPDAYLRDLKTGTLTQLTHNVDVTPAFTALVRKNVLVTRADGIKFWVRVALPANYQAGTRLPGMLWLYPYEYTDQAGYDRSVRTTNFNRYPTSQPRTIEFLATQGYAVANFEPPIIGETGRMNDNYVSDLRMNLYAVIDELDRQGFIDRTRLGIGGHSYGAFSTVNALVHTPFFKAGIAGDGMYNRTLTPTGFQSERRDLWSGQKTYLDMSPMLNADKLQGALLMYHNLEDQNVGTDPISSIRMMQALRSEGKVAALYLYPYEDHGPVTRETILDLWGRWTAWLDIYVKNAGSKAVKPTAVSNGPLPNP